VQKRRGRSLHKVTLDEKIEILHLCLLGQMTQKEVAEAMGVKKSAVGNLMRKARHNIHYLQEQRTKQEEK